jgi:hypothetical protein
MSIRFRALLTLVAGFILLGTTGCLVRRTVTEGNEVVSDGYVWKGPRSDR